MMDLSCSSCSANCLCSDLATSSSRVWRAVFVLTLGPEGSFGPMNPDPSALAPREGENWDWRIFLLGERFVLSS